MHWAFLLYIPYYIYRDGCVVLWFIQIDIQDDSPFCQFGHLKARFDAFGGGGMGRGSVFFFSISRPKFRFVYTF